MYDSNDKVSPRKYVYFFYSSSFSKCIQIFWDSLYYYSEHDGAYAGGGGGGVLINGEGPGKRVNKVGLKEYRGEGFGGGGNCHEDNDNDGHSGVIIIEIVKD